MGSADESNRPVTVQTALSRIIAQEPVSLSVLNDAIEMAKNPAHISAFADPLIAPSCMFLLLHNKPDKPKRLKPKSRSKRLRHKDEDEDTGTWVEGTEGTYVLMCVQLMAISIQSYLMGDSERHAYLERLKDSTSLSIGPDGQPDFLFDFGSYVARAVHDEFVETTEFLGVLCKKKMRLSQPVHLPSLDSLGQNYAEALVGILYLQRDTILAARYEVPTCWKGWSVLFYQLWVYIRGISGTKRLFVYLRDLVCRFALVSTGDIHEYNLLYQTVRHLHDATGDGIKDERNRPMSNEDMQTITDAYSKRFSQTSADDPPPGMEFSGTILRWVLPGLNSKTRYMLLPIAEASMKRLWHVFDTGDTTNNVQKGHISSFSVIIFAEILSFFEDNNIEEAGKVALVNLLIKHDVVNLVGRLILLPTLERLKGANKRFWIGMLSINRERITATNAMFKQINQRYTYTRDDFNEWLNTRRGTRNLSALDNDMIIQTIREEWAGVGHRLGMTIEEGWAGCSFPRCPAPVGPAYYACSVCEITGYCSRKCQIAHWEFEEAPTYRHRKECPKLASKPIPFESSAKKTEWQLYEDFNKVVPKEVKSDEEESDHSDSSEDETE
ncbi:hypothetical protein BDV93DRAFT_525689 [Ceratobasidium sp. AG-I]|nr:hypothetical protein BDV93DRAFT_525689 [Ceratobasidium sp. AG-I]